MHKPASRVIAMECIIAGVLNQKSVTREHNFHRLTAPLHCKIGQILSDFRSESHRAEVRAPT